MLWLPEVTVPTSQCDFFNGTERNGATEWCQHNDLDSLTLFIQTGDPQKTPALGPTHPRDSPALQDQTPSVSFFQSLWRPWALGAVN